MIKRVMAAALAVSIAASMMSGVRAANLSKYAKVESKYLTGSDGSRVGVEYYVTNTFKGPICFYARVATKENAEGDVHAGALLMKPREQHVRFGSFRALHPGDWTVHIQHRADDSCI